MIIKRNPPPQEQGGGWSQKRLILFFEISLRADVQAVFVFTNLGGGNELGISSFDFAVEAGANTTIFRADLEASTNSTTT